MPRAAVGLACVVLSVGVLALPPLAAALPPGGLAHGAAASTLFLILVAILFIPLGDTRAMLGAVWAGARRRVAP